MPIMTKFETYCLHVSSIHIAITGSTRPYYRKYVNHNNIFPKIYKAILISKEEYTLLCSINDDNIFLLVAFQIFKKYDK
jgi:hypothetical protein